jgi:hypothetical protein
LPFSGIIALLLHAKHQEVINTIALNKVLLTDQHEPGALGFFDYDVFVDAVVIAFAVAIDDAQQRAAAHRCARVPEQANRLRDFVIGL